MSEEKTMRLSQVARKLNVATPVITAYLAAEGFRLENNPNTKVTSEQYTMLAKEFADAAIDKEEAAELVIGQAYEKSTKISHKKESITSTPKTSTISPPIIPATPPQEEASVIKSINSVATPAITPTIPIIEIKEESLSTSKKIHTPDTKTEVNSPIHEALPSPLVETIQTATPTMQPSINKISLLDPGAIKGVTVVGKINLERPKKFQQVTSSDLRNLPKKPLNAFDLGNVPKKRPRNRVSDPTTASKPTAAHNPKAGPGNYKNRPKFTHKTPEQPKVVVSEKEIQEQIKNTLAKLGGNKTIANRAKYRREKRSIFAEEQAEEHLQATQNAKTLQVTEFIPASDLASLMGISINDLLSTCMNLGMLVSINQRLDAEAITIIADEFDYQVAFIDIKAEEIQEEEIEIDPSTLIERPPIVTIMGHVDHGKTSLLDYIRHTQITKTEAGGITQHIGAYEVTMKNGHRIAFLDTPGHEAFTAMRSRGVQLTDIAIIVIAADDGVKPQTKEAINHAKLANLPMIFAINKIDKSTANLDKVKEGLAQLNILVEDWGGKYQVQGVSALTGQGVEELLDKVLLEAELLELKANPNKKAKGTVVEASLDKGRGYLSTLMVQEGTLRIGEVILAGGHYGKIKAMFNYQGKNVKEAPPSTPIQILGLNGAPQAGDTFVVITSEKEAKEIATHRQQILREQSLRTKTHITLDEIGRRIAIGNFKELNLIIKGDVDGSVEALADSLLKLSTEEIKVKVVYKGVGTIIESDVLLAAASDAIIIGFQVRPSMNVQKLAESKEVEIRLYSIIYNAINNIKDAMQGMLGPVIEEFTTGSALVKEVFKITGIGLVAGCYVTEGQIKKINEIRLIREGIVIYTGTMKHLKHFKADIQQAKTGTECGISITKFNDIKVGDTIEGFEKKTIERKL